MQITAKSNDVTRIDVQDYGEGWSFKSLRLSDIHIDSPFCDRRLLKQHMDKALSDNPTVFINGDLFDAMQGPKDPRASYRELKEYLKGNDYFDRVLEDGYEFFKPYKDILAMVGYGNHEYSVVRHNGTDLIQRFVGNMRQIGSPVVAGGYGGFIRISAYSRLKTPDATYWIRYNHGAGGEAPVTKGMIQVNRQAVFLEGLDEVWNGHNHNDYITHVSTLRPNGKDNIVQGLVTYLRTPGYKNEYSTSNGHGFAVSRNMAPTPRGAVWCDMTHGGNHNIRAAYTADMI